MTTSGGATLEGKKQQDRQEKRKERGDRETIIVKYVVETMTRLVDG